MPITSELPFLDRIFTSDQEVESRSMVEGVTVPRKECLRQRSRCSSAVVGAAPF